MPLPPAYFLCFCVISSLFYLIKGIFLQTRSLEKDTWANRILCSYKSSLFSLFQFVFLINSLKKTFLACIEDSSVWILLFITLLSVAAEDRDRRKGGQLLLEGECCALSLCLCHSDLVNDYLLYLIPLTLYRGKERHWRSHCSSQCRCWWFWCGRQKWLWKVSLLENISQFANLKYANSYIIWLVWFALGELQSNGWLKNWGLTDLGFMVARF